MNDEPIDVSFVVPAKNEESNIARCIESLLACDSTGLTVEICVVDNGSTDRTVSLARSLDVTVIERPGLSISALRNVGARVSQGTWIAFVDADVTVESDWLENAVREIRKPGVAAVGSSPSIPAGSNWVVRTWHLQISFRPDHAERDWLASMNMLVSRDVFEQVDGFDEMLLTCEDVDLGYRITERYRIVYDKTIRAIHYGEAQSLVQLFRKEAWRGSFNYRGVFRHGWRPGELPSLLQPILTGTGLLGIMIGILMDEHWVVLAGVAMFAAFPVAKTIQTIIHTGVWHAVPALLIVWSTYSLARVWSAIIETKSLITGSTDRMASL